MKTAPNPIPKELVLRHWQMVHHLMWELQRTAWPYAPQGHHYHRGRYGLKELFDYAAKDPRFAAEGLEWKQPPCAFHYCGEVEVAAIGLFMGRYVGTGRRGHETLNKWLYTEIKGGPLRTLVEREMFKLWREYDPATCPPVEKMPHEFDFMNPSLFSSERVI